MTGNECGSGDWLGCGMKVDVVDVAVGRVVAVAVKRGILAV